MRKKKIIFQDLESKHATLKVRLRHDGVRQGEFFSFLVDKYINNDKRIISIMSELREKKKTLSKKRRKINTNDIEKGKELEQLFNLSEEQKNEIYDILEREHGEL